MLAPVVTGISPKEGPPGTRVTIRGENLGKSPQDLVGLTICGTDCLLSAEWVAPNKIIARSGPAKGRGDIIVTTKSFGQGTCTIQFHSLTESIGPLKESAVWIDESHLINSAWGRKRATVVSQLHQDNPLGLSDEDHVKKFPEEELHEMFPDGSGNLSSESFVPVWFLVENHYGATFQDLQAGLNCLKRRVNTQKEGELSFLKANVGAVLDQLDTLSALQENIRLVRETAGPVSTEKIETAILKAKTEADTLFKDVLGRRDRADATRNALGVLQRFKFLFNLPCSIERNIQKGDYDVVINDYSRAKSLFADTEVEVFRKVYQEVEQRIAKFREMLVARLHDLPMQLDKQKRLIKYLVNLEAPGDPAWDCLKIQQEYILQLQRSCREMHVEQDIASCEAVAVSATATPTKGMGGSGGKPGGLAPPPRLGRGDRRGSNFGIRSESWQDRPPCRVLFAEELCRLTMQELPNLWKLGQSYFQGHLLMKEVGSEVHTVSSDKHAFFTEMTMQVVQGVCRQVRGAMLGDQLTSPGQLPWPEPTKDPAKQMLPRCIQQVRLFYAALLELELPNEIIQQIQRLLFDLRLECLRFMFLRAAEEVRNLHTRETWNVESDPDHGSITQLPHVFESTVLKTIQLVREVMEVGTRELELLGNTKAEVEMVALWQELLLGFPFALERLSKSVTSQIAIHPSEVGSVPDKTGLVATPTGSGLEGVDGGTNNVKLLLVILGNCNFTRQHVLPRLFEFFVKHGFPKVESVQEEALNSFVRLDNSLFNTYVERKCDPIVGGIEQRMYAGHFDWAKCPRVFGVRPYVKGVLVDIITVHCEIHGISPSLVGRALRRIIEMVCEEVCRLLSCIEQFSAAGSVQVRIDLKALRLAFNDYLTETARVALEEALDALPLVNSVGDNKCLEAELNMFQKRMRYQLLCFKCGTTSNG